MAESSVRIPPPSTGPYVRTIRLNIGGQDVEIQAVVLSDPTSAYLLPISPYGGHLLRGSMGGLPAVTQLQSAAAVGVGPSFQGYGGIGTYQVVASGDNTLSALIAIQGSHTNSAWITLGTMTLSGTSGATNGMAVDMPWPFVRSSVLSFSQSSGSNKVLTVTRAV